MVFPPDVFDFVPDGSLLAARLAEHVDHSPRGTGGKAIVRHRAATVCRSAR
jgi:hypothetical protein